MFRSEHVSLSISAICFSLNVNFFLKLRGIIYNIHSRNKYYVQTCV